MIAEREGKFYYNGQEFETFDEALNASIRDRAAVKAKEAEDRKARNEIVKRSYRLIGRGKK